MSLKKKDQDAIANLLVEMYDEDDRPPDPTSDWFDEAMTLAKDYYVVQTPTIKNQIKSQVNNLIRRIQTQGSEDDYTYEFIDQIRAVMQHGHDSQDEYNSENEYEMRRERQAMDRGY